MGNPEDKSIKTQMINKYGSKIIIPINEATMSKRRFINLLFIYECGLKYDF